MHLTTSRVESRQGKITRAKKSWINCVYSILVQTINAICSSAFVYFGFFLLLLFFLLFILSFVKSRRVLFTPIGRQKKRSNFSFCMKRNRSKIDNLSGTCSFHFHSMLNNEEKCTKTRNKPQNVKKWLHFPFPLHFFGIENDFSRQDLHISFFFFSWSEQWLFVFIEHRTICKFFIDFEFVR